ncbi:hypothetical protein Nepgr_017352 [Nepenthes gracilis]|uniref:Uncharacterized protein n=1 Tax=Nepenthes gracilis TaxID=150966 RepID=A0AAD3XTA1_NEPGR|nr:hypothetical protein Nepgr_017352 [Nepenthes gracilis]
MQDPFCCVRWPVVWQADQARGSPPVMALLTRSPPYSEMLAVLLIRIGCGCRFGLRLERLSDVDFLAGLVLSVGMRISTTVWQCGFGKMIRLDRRLAGDWFGLLTRLICAE